MPEPSDADLLASRRGPLDDLAHALDGAHDQLVARAEADRLAPVLELVDADDLLDGGVIDGREGLRGHVKGLLDLCRDLLHD